jgi:hypothetical protein
MRSLVNRLSVAPLLIAAVTLTGCPVVTPMTESRGPAGFTLSGPREPLTILNGQDRSVEITLTWKANTHEEVGVSAEVEPRDRGVTARVPAAKVTVDQSTAKIVVMVGETAEGGDYKVTVTGKTAAAGATDTSFAVKVPARD